MIFNLTWEYKTKYHFYFTDSIPSTNTYFKENYDSYLDKSVLIAKEQTEGRGRYNRIWESKDDIMFSILRYKKAPYSIITPLAIVMALESIGIESGIKWPNDIYIKQKKAAGILIEDIYIDSFKASIIGIGINMTDKPHYDGIGLNTKESKNSIIERILTQMDFLEKLPMEDLIEFYRKNSIVIGRKIRYQEKEYVAVGINKDGYLLLENDSKTLLVSSDEIYIKEAIL